MVMRSLDREQKETYHLKIKAENLIHHRVGKRSLAGNLKSQTDPNNFHLAFDETLVVVSVGDENDNPPIFENQGKPAVAAIPLEAAFGYQVIKLTVSIIRQSLKSIRI